MKRIFIFTISVLAITTLQGCTSIFGKKEIEDFCVIPSYLPVNEIFEQKTETFLFNIVTISPESRSHPFLFENHIEAYLTHKDKGFSRHATSRIEGLVVTGRVYKKWPDIFSKGLGGGKKHYNLEVSDGKQRMLIFSKQINPELKKQLESRCQFPDS